MDVNKILECREKKNNLILSYLSRYQVISLKANIPGTDKRIKEAYLLISYFDHFIKESSIESFLIDGEDGPMKIYLFSKEISLKEKMIEIEETNPLGRFVDIDVYLDESKSLSRGKMRKCFMCDQPAFFCGRMKAHSTSELVSFIKKRIKEEVSSILFKTLDYSILGELNLHPKFGLVTPLSNGSHNDMNYEIMVKAKNAIIPYLIDMFWIGYETDTLEQVFKKIRKIGMATEEAMFNATKGINAYKGLIFDLGLVIASLGYKLSNLKDSNSIFDIVKIMTKGITLELENSINTFGGFAYQKYGIKGARGEAEEGFIYVQEVLKSYYLDDIKDRYQALSYLIFKTEDTVLLKRCGSINNYKEIKLKFNNFTYNEGKIIELTRYCIDNNLSFGGSADLLVVSIFIWEIYKIFNLRL